MWYTPQRYRIEPQGSWDIYTPISAPQRLRATVRGIYSLPLLVCHLQTPSTILWPEKALRRTDTHAQSEKPSLQGGPERHGQGDNNIP